MTVWRVCGGAGLLLLGLDLLGIPTGMLDSVTGILITIGALGLLAGF